MYPPACFSCGYPIGHLWSDYFKKLEQERKRNPAVDVDYESDAKYNALRELEIASECCRRMFICQIQNVYDLVI